MFDEPNTTNTGIDQVAEEIGSQPQNLGLGHNPSLVTPTSPSFTPSSNPPVANDQPTAQAPATIQPTVKESDSSQLPSDLVNIQKEAIEQLMPLVHKLDQAPEERFKTLMMVIQASDDQALIKDAYAAANAIEDDTTRAQALLSLVNEINYFSNKTSA